MKNVNVQRQPQMTIIKIIAKQYLQELLSKVKSNSNTVHYNVKCQRQASASDVNCKCQRQMTITMVNNKRQP